MKKEQSDKKIEQIEQYDFFDGKYIEKSKFFVDYSYAIGEFIINFNNLDHEINIAIADILESDGHYFGYLVVEKLSFINKTDLFYKLYLGLAHATDNQKNKSKLIKIKKELLDLNTFRNNVVHANWATLTKDKFVRTKTVVDNFDGMVKFVNRKITPKMIEKASIKIEKLSIQIVDYKENAQN